MIGGMARDPRTGTGQGDRHTSPRPTVTLRLGELAGRVDDAARSAGITRHAIIIQALREFLDRAESEG